MEIFTPPLTNEPEVKELNPKDRPAAIASPVASTAQKSTAENSNRLFSASSVVEVRENTQSSGGR